MLISKLTSILCTMKILNSFRLVVALIKNDFFFENILLLLNGKLSSMMKDFQEQILRGQTRF